MYAGLLGSDRNTVPLLASSQRVGLPVLHAALARNHVDELLTGVVVLSLFPPGLYLRMNIVTSLPPTPAKSFLSAPCA